MRVTFVLPEANLSGGVRVVAIYAERLSRRGHSVSVVSVPEAPRSLRDRLWHLRHNHRWLPRARSSPSHLDTLPIAHHRLESRRPVEDRDVPDADVIIGTWWETAEWISRLSARKGAPVHLLQGDEVDFYAPGERALRERVVRALGGPMRKIAVSSWVASRLRQYGLTGEERVIRNAVDAGPFHAPARGKRPVPTVGMIYSRAFLKGSDVVIDAVRRAREALPGLEVVAFSHETPDRYMPLPAGARFVQTPSQEEIPRLYAACDAWLFGSRSEGFGLPLLEAMACRTPVIAAPAGAAPELLAEGGGILLPSADASEMAGAIGRVARMDEPAWRAMSERAVETATRYTWDDATALLEEELAAAASAREGAGAAAAAAVGALA
jgi:glycosyltransferase involved in cell wall biosynthesis